MKHLKITMQDAEYEAMKKAAGHEPLATYARRAAMWCVCNNAQWGKTSDLRKLDAAPKISENQGKEAGVAVKVENDLAPMGSLESGNVGGLSAELDSIFEQPGREVYKDGQNTVVEVPPIARKTIRAMKKKLMGPDAKPRKRELCQHGFYAENCPRGCKA